MAAEEQTSARHGRCANHPAVARVGTCTSCGRGLCLACAVPVRGRLVGPECLAQVLVDAPEQQPVPVLISSAGRLLSLAGFGVIVIASALPWSGVGDGSRLFGAWAMHWSLYAAVAGVVGVGLVVTWWLRPVDLRLEAGVLAATAVAAGTASYLHHRFHLLAGEATVWPIVAMIGAAMALLGAAVSFGSILRAGRRPL